MFGIRKKSTDDAVQAANAENKKSANWIFRILSILCAVILWFYVMTVESNNFEKTYSGVTLDIRGMESLSALSLSGLPTDTVEITVTGEKQKLEAMGSEDIKPYVILPENAEKGQYVLPVKIDGIPDNTNVSIKPEKVTVLVENTDTRTVSLTRVAGNHDDSLLSYHFSLSEITVTGSVSLLERIDHAELNISSQTPGININSSYFGAIVLIDVEGKEILGSYLTKSNDYATVEVKVMQTKKLPLTVTGTGGEAADIVFDEGSVKTVTVKGEASQIAAIPDFLSLATVDLTNPDGANETRFTFSYQQILSAIPQDVALHEIDGILISALDQEKLPSASFTATPKSALAENTLSVSLSGATVKSLSSALKAQFDPKQTVLITLRGTQDAVHAVTAEDIALTINMAGKTAKGWVDAPLSVILQKDVDGLEISHPESVRVLLSAK